MAKKYEWKVDDPTASQLQDALNAMEEDGWEIYQLLSPPLAANQHSAKLVVVGRKPVLGGAEAVRHPIKLYPE
ncbi:MAG: hypothetical protein ACO1SX_13060 [Actinomycetota bacterium]